MKTIGVLNGPNLAQLGTRETEIYGTETLEDLEQLLRKEAQTLGATIITEQSNHEGIMIDTLERWSKQGVTGIIINPAAYSHTSVALRDAISGLSTPCIEVHISNLYQRESFRQHSLTAAVCQGAICGLGFTGYVLALNALIQQSNPTSLTHQKADAVTSK
tara:strand:+ start:53200 stop:53682 length:483 start_codon:yes stop_codon:yes gene_type:complete